MKSLLTFLYSIVDPVRPTGRVSLEPLRPKRGAPSHGATWDSVVIPTTWNYKGVKVKGACFDITGTVGYLKANLCFMFGQVYVYVHCFSADAFFIQRKNYTDHKQIRLKYG